MDIFKLILTTWLRGSKTSVDYGEEPFSAIPISHNVKKLVDQKCPRVKILYEKLIKRYSKACNHTGAEIHTYYN